MTRLMATTIVVGLLVPAVASAAVGDGPSGHAYHRVPAAVGARGSWVSLTYDSLGWDARVTVRGNIPLPRNARTRTFRLEFDAATTRGPALDCTVETRPNGTKTPPCPPRLHHEPQPIFAIFQTAHSLRTKFVTLHAGFNRFSFRVQVRTPGGANMVGAVFVSSPLLHLHDPDTGERPLLHGPDTGILFEDSLGASG